MVSDAARRKDYLVLSKVHDSFLDRGAPFRNADVEVARSSGEPHA